MISGYEYCATLQLRTPLAVLLFDGTTAPPGCGQPENPFDDWAGIWLPKAKSWRELGIDLDDDSQDHHVASDIGPVNRNHYKRFLFYLRRIAEEKSVPITDRIKALKAVMEAEEFHGYRRKLGGERKVIDALFPKLVASIPNVNSTSANTLWGQGLKTVAKLRLATDKELLKLPGVGNKTLLAIRMFCDAFDGNPCAERIDSAASIPAPAAPSFAENAQSMIERREPGTKKPASFRFGRAVGNFLRKAFPKGGA